MHHAPFAMTKPSYMHLAKVPFAKKGRNAVVSRVGMIGIYSALPCYRSLFLTNPSYQGYLTATLSEDWTVILDVLKRALATEANAKEAAKALRRVQVHHLIQPLGMATPHNNYQWQKCASQTCSSLIIRMALSLPPTPTLPPPSPRRSSQTSSTTQDLPLAHISAHSCSQSHVPTPIHSHLS